MILNFYYQVLHLLAACQNYEMDSMQSLIRTKVNSGEFPAPKGSEVFAAYAIASSKGLIPEMENAARSTLCLPMTFETLGEGLRLFDGLALRDLANFRLRCRDNLVTCFSLYLDPSGPSKFWVHEVMPTGSTPSQGTRQHSGTLPGWLKLFFSQKLDHLKRHKFSHQLMARSSVWEKCYWASFKINYDCNFCLRTQAIDGPEYRAGLNNMLRQAIEKVRYFIPLTFSTATNFICRRYAVIMALFSVLFTRVLGISETSQRRCFIEVLAVQ